MSKSMFGCVLVVILCVTGAAVVFAQDSDDDHHDIDITTQAYLSALQTEPTPHYKVEIWIAKDVKPPPVTAYIRIGMSRGYRPYMHGSKVKVSSSTPRFIMNKETLASHDVLDDGVHVHTFIFYSDMALQGRIDNVDIGTIEYCSLKDTNFLPNGIRVSAMDAQGKCLRMVEQWRSLTPFTCGTKVISEPNKAC